MFRFVKKLFSTDQRKVSVVQLIELVEKAYTQGYWDASHKNDPRVTKKTKNEGLANFLEKAAKELEQA